MEPHLAYCANVHPGESLALIWEALAEHAPRIRRLHDPDGTLGVGLYLPAAAAEPLAERPESAEGFRAFLREAGLKVLTANAFPYGGFHAPRVKEAVYRPDWTAPRRLAFTVLAGKALAALLEPGETGTVSTLPVGWKGCPPGPDGLRRAGEQLLEAAEAFRRLREETGRTLVLCLEPEPLCVLETTEETVAFFQRFLLGAPEGQRRHLGVCFDTGHLAVAFEDLAASVRRLAGAGIRIGKVQLSSALALKRPGEAPGAVRSLMAYDEPRFLHQVASREGDRLADLGQLDPGAAPWATSAEWRCHFHVPLDRADYPPLGTTRAEILPALPELLALPERPHFEVETYTWSVLPAAERAATPERLCEGIARELAWARQALGGGAARRATSLF